MHTVDDAGVESVQGKWKEMFGEKEEAKEEKPKKQAARKNTIGVKKTTSKSSRTKKKAGHSIKLLRFWKSLYGVIPHKRIVPSFEPEARVVPSGEKATLLTKDVSRETLAVTDLKGQKMIVTLKAGDMLEFRPKGRRYRYEVPLAACYNLAMIFSANEWHKEKMKRYEERKKAGFRVKRPRRLPRIFNQHYYEALKMK